MRKIKILTSLIATGSILTPVSFIATSCNKVESSKDMGSTYLNIKDGVLTGFNPNTDLSKFETLNIPEGVKTIGKNAFSYALTAGKYTHGVNNNIKTIVFPSTLEKIEIGAFNSCTGIDTLDFSKLDNVKLNSLKILSTEENKTFGDFKAKGKILISSSAKRDRSDFNTNIMLAGLPDAWIFETEVPNISESHIVDINDFHGAAPGFGDDFFGKTNQHNPGSIRLAEETQKIINKYPGSVFLSAGDYEAGDPYSTCQHGKTLYPVLSAMDIRYSALGNHSWEWGSEQIEGGEFDELGRTSDTQGHYFINANVIEGPEYRDKKWDPNSEDDYHIWNDNRAHFVDPYKVINMNGHDVCFIGLLTHDTMTDGNQMAVADLTFMKKEDYLTAVKYTKKLAKEELGDENYSKIESFILLTHCDSDQKVGEITGESEYMARMATPETDFDAIISGHSHKNVCGTVHNAMLDKEIWIGQAGVSGQRFVDTTLKFDDDKPKGQRLQSISMKLVKPQIDGEDTTGKGTPDYNKAHKQLETISKNTFFPVVKNVVETYNHLKVTAMRDLQSPIGKIKNEGLPYAYAEDPQIGTAYLQTENILEPMGVWGCLSHQIEFCQRYKTLIQKGECFQPCIAINNVDSYKAGFNISEGEDVLKKKMFDLHPYENQTAYGCLSLYQLKQYINYVLEGGEDQFDYSHKFEFVDNPQAASPKPVEFYYEENPADPSKNVVEWDKTETVSKFGDPDTKVTGVCSCPAVEQFSGLSFAVKEKRKSTAKGKEITIYQLDDSKEIRIYTPWDETNDIKDPTTWTLATDFADPAKNTVTQGYIPMISSTFTMQGGNAQNRMLHHWFRFNYEKEFSKHEITTQLLPRSFDMLTRTASMLYAEHLTKGISPIASEPSPLDVFVNLDYCKKMFRR